MARRSIENPGRPHPRGSDRQAGDPEGRAGDRPSRDARLTDALPAAGSRCRGARDPAGTGYDRPGLRRLSSAQRPDCRVGGCGRGRDLRTRSASAGSPCSAISGGGPHALAFAALLPERVRGGGGSPSPAPYAPRARLVAGMGEENVAEFGATLAGGETLSVSSVEPQAAEMAAVTPRRLFAAAFGDLIDEVDRGALDSPDLASIGWQIWLSRRPSGSATGAGSTTTSRSRGPWGFDLGVDPRKLVPPLAGPPTIAWSPSRTASGWPRGSRESRLISWTVRGI